MLQIERLQIERLQFFLHMFPKLTVGLVGDLFLDRYLEIDAQLGEPSIETGLETHQVVRVRNQPGAGGTVLNNLAALGVGNLVPLTVIGDDGHGCDLLQSLQSLPVDDSHVLRSRQPLTDAMCAQLCRHLQSVFTQTDGLIVLDQIDQRNTGVIDDRVRDCLRKMAQQHPQRLMYIDSRRWLSEFDFGTLKGNRAEVLAAVPDAPDVPTAMRQLNARTGQPVFCTLGDQGMSAACRDGRVVHVPSGPIDGPVDIVGAGDSATSGIVLSLLAGATEIEAAAVGNLVASITVQQLGTTGTATPQQMLDRWYETCD